MGALDEYEVGTIIRCDGFIDQDEPRRDDHDAIIIGIIIGQQTIYEHTMVRVRVTYTNHPDGWATGDWYTWTKNNWRTVTPLTPEEAIAWNL